MRCCAIQILVKIGGKTLIIREGYLNKHSICSRFSDQFGAMTQVKHTSHDDISPLYLVLYRGL